MINKADLVEAVAKHLNYSKEDIAAAMPTKKEVRAWIESAIHASIQHVLTNLYGEYIKRKATHILDKKMPKVIRNLIEKEASALLLPYYQHQIRQIVSHELEANLSIDVQVNKK